MSLLLKTKAHLIIEEELSRTAFRLEKKATEFQLCCPHPQHRERTPSCHVNLSNNQIPVGYIHCFGCGRKGHWNQWAEVTGWRKIPTRKQDKISEISADTAEILRTVGRDLLSQNQLVQNSEDVWKQIDEVVAQHKLLELNQNWRNLDKEFLKKFGVKRYIDNRTSRTWLILPVNVEDETVGLVRARMIPTKSKRLSNYINSKGKLWAVRKGLLGYDFVKKMKCFKKQRIVFIVEGPRDALWMLYHGIPSISILGAQNWPKSEDRNKEKIHQLLNLQAKKYIILFDNDKAGRKGSKKIAKDLAEMTSRSVSVLRYKLPKKEIIGKELDPAELSREHLQQIYRKVGGSFT